MAERFIINADEWMEVERGFGAFDMSRLEDDECVTASGLHDGGYVVWKRKPSGEQG